jgi:hypothetical protein
MTHKHSGMEKVAGFDVCQPLVLAGFGLGKISERGAKLRETMK